MKLLFLPLCVLVYLCDNGVWIEFCPSYATEKNMEVGPEGVYGAPVFACPFTFARVQSRFEFVEPGRDIICALITTGVTGITHTHHQAPHYMHTILERVYRVCTAMDI